MKSSRVIIRSAFGWAGINLRQHICIVVCYMRQLVPQKVPPHWMWGLLETAQVQHVARHTRCISVEIESVDGPVEGTTSAVALINM